MELWNRIDFDLSYMSFIGVFGSLSNNNNINTENSPLSAEVLAYEGIITQYVIQYSIEEYVPIIEAIMMQESGGKGNDPMQAAECGFNTKISTRAKWN